MSLGILGRMSTATPYCGDGFSGFTFSHPIHPAVFQKFYVAWFVHSFYRFQAKFLWFKHVAQGLRFHARQNGFCPGRPFMGFD